MTYLGQIFNNKTQGIGMDRDCEFCVNLQSSETDCVCLWLLVNRTTQKKLSFLLIALMSVNEQTSTCKQSERVWSNGPGETEMCPKHKWLENYRDFVKSLSSDSELCLWSWGFWVIWQMWEKHCDCLPITSREPWSSHYEQNFLTEPMPADFNTRDGKKVQCVSVWK